MLSLTGQCRIYAESYGSELSFPEDRPVLPLQPRCGACACADTDMENTDTNLQVLEQSSQSNKENNLDVTTKSIFESPERTQEQRVGGQFEYPEKKARYSRSSKKAKKSCSANTVKFRSKVG
eukprot:g66538.t1